jgi:hypothetical protein
MMYIDKTCHAKLKDDVSKFIRASLPSKN